MADDGYDSYREHVVDIGAQPVTRACLAVPAADPTRAWDAGTAQPRLRPSRERPRRLYETVTST